jgi:hypothetical protein
MGQVTIYLDEDTEQRVRAAARADGVSVSRWVADRVRQGTRTDWPASVRALAGAWRDFPSAETTRKGQGRDIPRRKL